MSKKTPQIRAGQLTFADAQPSVKLNSKAWFDWLADEDHHTFQYVDANGVFTARKERKQRGSCYWVAYRQFHNKLHKAYLGKSEGITESHLCEIAIELANHIAAYEQSDHRLVDGEEP
ncbi:MAG: hypothetical protein U0670_03750 [Anaerolineae bacterium]